MLQLNKSIVRNRLVYFLLLILIVILGLSSRKFGKALPSFLAEYAGDSLWALMVFCLVSLLKPTWKIWQVGLLSLAFSYFIELTQLYQAPWINSLRRNKFGGLILGYGFLWSDVVCYTFGVLVGVFSEALYYSIKAGRQKNTQPN